MVSSVQFSRSVMSDSLPPPWIAALQASLSITNSQSSLRLSSIESVMPSSHLILCRPLLLLPPVPLSIRVFSNESTLRMRWPKYWSFSFSIIPSKEIPGMISFRTDWLDLLAVQGTLKSSGMMINKWKNLFGESPGSPMVRTPHFHFREHKFDPSLILELRSWQPWGTVKKKKMSYLLMSMASFLATFKLLLLTVTSKVSE